MEKGNTSMKNEENVLHFTHLMDKIVYFYVLRVNSNLKFGLLKIPYVYRIYKVYYLHMIFFISDK